MSEKWCEEHITERNNWFVTQSGKKIEIQDDWKFCPICGANRPEEPKRLWEVLKIKGKNICISGNAQYATLLEGSILWKEMAQFSCDFFCGVVDEVPGELGTEGQRTSLVYKEDIKMALRNRI